MENTSTEHASHQNSTKKIMKNDAPLYALPGLMAKDWEMAGSAVCNNQRGGPIVACP